MTNMKLTSCSFAFDVKGNVYTVLYKIEADSWAVMTTDGQLLYIETNDRARQFMNPTVAKEILKNYLKTP